jgi:ABC-type glycerol-3-phosphate transport system substrate-binding protein
MIKKHMQSLTFYLIVVSVLLCGCKTKPIEPSETPSDTAKIKMVGDNLGLKIWIQAPQDIIDIFNRLTASSELLPIAIKYESFTLDQAETELELRLQRGDKPDVFIVDPAVMVKLVQGGYLADLDSFRQGDIKNLQQYYLDVPWFNGQLENIQYGIPLNIEVFTLFKRLDIVKQPLRNWEDYMDAVTKTMEAGYEGPVMGQGCRDWRLYYTLLGESKGLMYYNNKWWFDDKISVNSVLWQKVLFNRLGASYENKDVAAGIIGQSPIGIDIVNYSLGILSKEPSILNKWGIDILPIGASRTLASWVGGLVLCINKDTQYEREVLRLFDILVDKDFQVKLYDQTAVADYVWLPAHKLSWESMSLPTEFKTVILQMTDNGLAYPEAPNWREIRLALENIITDVIQNPKSEAYEEVLKLSFKLNSKKGIN